MQIKCKYLRIASLISYQSGRNLDELNERSLAGGSRKQE